MKRLGIRARAGALLLAAGGVGVGGLALAGTELVAYPDGYRESFVEYNRVDRPDRKRVRVFYVSKAAHEAAQPGQPLPSGTVLVMEDHNAALGADGNPARDAEGRMIAEAEITNVFVMEKRAGWGAEYPPDLRNGEWEYAWFLADGTRKADAEFEGCFRCHLSRAGRDYTFTYAKFLLDTR